MSCIKQTAKKYFQRPLPPYNAEDCKGQIKKGNDGKWYKSKKDLDDVYKWKIVIVENAGLADEYINKNPDMIDRVQRALQRIAKRNSLTQDSSPSPPPKEPEEKKPTLIKPLIKPIIQKKKAPMESRFPLRYFEKQRMELCGQAALNHLFQNTNLHVYQNILFTTNNKNRKDPENYYWTDDQKVYYFDLYKFCESRNKELMKDLDIVDKSAIRTFQQDLGCLKKGNFDVHLLELAVKKLGLQTTDLPYQGERGSDEALLTALQNILNGTIYGIIVNIKGLHYTAVFKSPDDKLVEIDSLERPKNNTYGTLFNAEEMLEHLKKRKYVHAFTISDSD
jgi:hypothetical protein